MSSEGKACADCVSWDPIREGAVRQRQGFCHYGPPSLSGNKWPRTKAEDWCSAFVPMVEPTEPTLPTTPPGPTEHT